MSNLKVNSINDASGGSTAVLYGVAAPTNSMGFRNRIINGAMVIDQRNAGASVTGGVGYTFPVDRFKFYSAAASKLSGQRSTTAPTGFTNSLLMTSLAATTPGAGDEYQLYHQMEGFNVADLGFGTASAQSVTLSFWVRSSLTGTFSGAVNNADGTRSYVFTYAISAANTWEQKTITVPGDTTGTWATGNTTGLQVVWDLGSGSNLNGTAGAWASGFDTRTSGAVSLNGTNGATFYITGVQLEAGSVASPFERRDYGRELMMCQRYCEVNASLDGNAGFWSGQASNGQVYFTSIPFCVSKRAIPAITITGESNSGMGTVSATVNSVSGFRISANATVTTNLAYMRITWIASAEL